MHSLPYRYEDGKLLWCLPGRKRKLGVRIGRLDPQGYRVVKLEGKNKKEHRLVWEMFNGPIPDGMQVDHINRDRSDNRIENLRLVSSQENSFNTAAKGYTRHRNRFVSRICINGDKIVLGSFETEKEARQSYLDAKNKLHLIKEH